MRKIYFVFLCSIIIPISSFSIIKDKSTIKWKGTKSIGSYHEGYILVENSFVNIDKNVVIGGEININMDSITCTDIEDQNSNQYLIEHLKSNDFFSVSTFPVAFLKITNIKHKEGDDYLITADLTIKDKTHPIDFFANIKIDKNAALASGKLNIDRTKYDIKYKSKTWYPDLGDKFINDIFELYFNLVALP